MSDSFDRDPSRPRFVGIAEAAKIMQLQVLEAGHRRRIEERKRREREQELEHERKLAAIRAGAATLPVVANATSGTAATSGTEQPEVDSVLVVDAKTGNRKATGKAGGRPRKAKRTPEESKVMKCHKAGMSFWEIDDELRLASGQSAKIHEAVTRRERRNKPQSADKTGQNRTK